MGGISNEPMSPVENEPIPSSRVRPEVGHQGLNEGQHRYNYSNNSVRIPLSRYARPAAHIDENEYNGRYSQGPNGRHKNPMKDEPEVLAHQLFSDPSEAEIAGEKDAQRSGEEPGKDHKGAVEFDEDIPVSADWARFG